MAVPKTPYHTINDWAEQIALALLDRQAWFRRGVPRDELGALTGLNELQVRRGCWHGRLHGLFQYEATSASYCLTPLGVALARRLKAMRAAEADALQQPEVDALQQADVDALQPSGSTGVVSPAMSDPSPSVS